jgi:hypothetical protein
MQIYRSDLGPPAAWSQLIKSRSRSVNSSQVSQNPDWMAQQSSGLQNNSLDDQGDTSLNFSPLFQKTTSL